MKHLTFIIFVYALEWKTVFKRDALSLLSPAVGLFWGRGWREGGDVSGIKIFS